jgi:hypothetical protein
MLGDQRTQVGWRVLALLWQGVIGYLLVLVIGTIAAIWALVDLIWQLVTNRNDLSEDSTPAQWVSMTAGWSADQTVFGLTGGASKEFQALPSKSTAL